MKPVELSLRGFRSYPTPVTIDFTGKGLTAALGDTGAGKSTMLEAITFALFGKSSWDGRETKHLIADRSETGSVDLTFTHGDHRWHVHRTIHATNSNLGRHHLKNLDTGDEVDGAKAVSKRIETVLHMDCDTFLRVGLLPQGKFDRLLTSSPADRSKLLRELFGAESLVSVQDIARDRCANLKELLAVARAKRDAMGNPAEAATEAAARASAAEALTTRLGASVDAMNELQDKVSTARAAASAAEAAARSLADGMVRDAVAKLDELGLVAERLETQRAFLQQHSDEIDDREAALTAEIQQREDRGEGLDRFTRAAVILEHLAARADVHRAERRELDAQSTQLVVDGDRIAADEAALNDRIEQVRPLIDEAALAAKAGQEVRTAESALRVQVSESMQAALKAAEAVVACGSATGALDDANKAVVRFEGKLVDAKAALIRAEVRESALDLNNRAALIAADLHPDDDCPVCRQKVPDSFEAGSAAGVDEIQAVKAALRQVKRLRDKVGGELAQSKAQVTAALQAASSNVENLRVAELQAQLSAAATCEQFDEFAALAAQVGGAFDAVGAAAALTAAMNAIAAEPGRYTSHQHVSAPITSALALCEEAVSAHVAQLRDTASEATTNIEVDRRSLANRRETYDAAIESVATASARETEAIARTVADIHALPDQVRSLLPGEIIDITSDSVEQAISMAIAGKSEIERLLTARETGRKEKADVLDRQRQVEQDVGRFLDQPLTELRSALEAWAKDLRRAVDYFGDTCEYRVPFTPTEPGIAGIRPFAAELLEVTAAVCTELSGASAAHHADVEAATSSLADAAARLADVVSFEPTADLTTAQSMHPIIAAAAIARREAEQWRAKHSAAAAQFQTAADLDFAIAAGQARFEALDVLRRELVDARFLGHLTKLNSRALLGIASTLLARLTDRQFGFADNCDIVSRHSKVVHSANRLSGGEKFLASLALALALAELHSRSGPRLGALFLDEGFATLDTAALQAALEVLRTQTGGDRLVMVISHLHAVAEAVDDVLWVERPLGGGSAARWLTTAEREELVNADLSSGLH
ncbi:AAA family ATPase [Nocardia sp. NPDC059246]|uniref:AAA family ATPase n=1 Tax=unclassified Nocardia TaxID=2637762 RepID=UPI003677BDB8